MGVTFSLRYKSWDYFNYQADTNDKYVLYKILNNYNNLPGYARMSKDAVYINESVNHDQPYIKTHAGSISEGFINCSTVWLNGTNKFSGDTLILSFTVKPPSGPTYNMKNKYLRQ